jgi:UDPglucose 6-dehydrogenase/GDP-mannose 6-dehydrogenase
MRVAIVGTGYVGLVTGTCLAERGHTVTCIDVDATKVDSINAGRAPIHEQGLTALLERNVGRRLRATTELTGTVAASDITFIAVGTPAAEGKIDLRFVEQAATEVGAALRTTSSYHVVVVKSTVIPGTTDGVVRRCVEAASGKTAGSAFGLGMNPEFLTEGRAVDDFMNPDRLVLGGIDERTRARLAEVYESFADTPRILTNNRTAEMIKYASNSLLATMISFSNEIGQLCARIGDVDVVEVMRGVHQSTYLTVPGAGSERVRAPITSFLEAGCGFGGSCLPKDVTALVAQGASVGVPMNLLRSVLDVNGRQATELFRLVTKHRSNLSGVPVTVLGLAFKPDTDDVRESPAFPLIRQLRQAGAHITAFDPVARPVGHADLAGVKLSDSLADAVATAEVVVLVTRWDEFAALPKVLRKAGRDPLVVDGRRMLRRDDFKHYEGIGL